MAGAAPSRLGGCGLAEAFAIPVGRLGRSRASRLGGCGLAGAFAIPVGRLGRSRALPVGRGGGGVAGVADQLQHDLMDGFDRFHADQFLVQARVEVGESIGVDAQLMQDRGVQSFDVEGIVDGG